jgi:hypothetical protein
MSGNRRRRLVPCGGVNVENFYELTRGGNAGVGHITADGGGFLGGVEIGEGGL